VTVSEDWLEELEEYRRPLTGYCYRMLGSAFEADDAVQETIVRAWKNIDGFEGYDITALVSLLHDDAVMSMPPYDLWLQGRREMEKWFLGEGIGCRGSRLVATAANGQAAFGSYRPSPDGGWKPWAIQIIDVADGWIVGHHSFLDTELFAVFGLPARLDT